MRLTLIWNPDTYKKRKEILKKVNELLDKALIIDSNNSRVYTTKGMLSHELNKWEKAEEYYKKAIEINSNDVTAHNYYSLYFESKPEPDLIKALEQINISYRLDPYSAVIINNTISHLLSNDKLIEAEELYKNKSSFLSEGLKSGIKNAFILTKERISAIEKKDRTEGIKYYNRLIDKDPQSAFLYSGLSDIYNEVLNDGVNYLKYSKKAYELDSTNFWTAKSYFDALVENKKFIEANKILQNNIIKQQLGQILKPKFLFNYYYYQEDYKKTQEILNDNLIHYQDYYYELSTNFAQQNKIEDVHEILNMGVLKSWEKAVVFAILEEKDSMYYYMNNEKSNPNIVKINSFNELDPYRKEKRYKEYLRKNYLPITHWNE